MRPEKQYLVREVASHLEKSDYLFLANYERSTVVDLAELRSRLAAEEAEFHVVKNRILKIAARERGLPDLDGHLTGQTAIVTGGRNPSGVAKILAKFFEERSKVEVKAGVLNSHAIDRDAVEQLAKLPSLETLRAQLLGLLNQPAQQLVFVLNGVPQAVVNLLQARNRQQEEQAGAA